MGVIQSTYGTIVRGKGGGMKAEIKELNWFGCINLPKDTIEYGYELETRPTALGSGYYIGGGCSAPCYTNMGSECIVFGADSLNEVTLNYCTLQTSWTDYSWGFNYFYSYACEKITYPLKVKCVFGDHNFKLYLNDFLVFEINSNKIDPNIWNRYRVFYSGPMGTDCVESSRYSLKNFYIK